MGMDLCKKVTLQEIEARGKGGKGLESQEELSWF